LEQRTAFITKLEAKEVNVVFHYVPLHSSPAGLKYGRIHGTMTNTDNIAYRLIRLPLWIGLDEEQQNIVIDSLFQALGEVK